MLKITIVTIGKFKEQAFADLEQEYFKRLGPLSKTELVEIPEVPYLKENEAPNARKKEADKILQYIEPSDFVIALDERGKIITTTQFALKLSSHQATGQKIVFVIGSSTGLDEKIKKRANWLFSLSPLTFTHNFARVILIEQIYRALTILSGKIYHK